jgi:hypothetical protein
MWVTWEPTLMSNYSIWIPQISHIEMNEFCCSGLPIHIALALQNKKWLEPGPSRFVPDRYAYNFVYAVLKFLEPTTTMPILTHRASQVSSSLKGKKNCKNFMTLKFHDNNKLWHCLNILFLSMHVLNKQIL